MNWPFIMPTKTAKREPSIIFLVFVFGLSSDFFVSQSLRTIQSKSKCGEYCHKINLQYK